MGLERIVVFTLRLAELAFGAIVAGINGKFLHDSEGVDSWTIGRFIYAEVVAGISLFFALIWLIPFSSSLTNWPLDIFISLNWWAVFGLLVDVSLPASLPSHHMTCGINWISITDLGVSSVAT